MLSRRTCLGPDGKPAAAQSGAHAEELRRDARGCVVQKSLVDAEGRPAASRHGVHAFRQTVDPFCEPLSKACLGKGGKPVSCGPGQPARYVYKLDRRGFRISTKHYDASGRPSRDASYRVFEVRVERDEKGNEVGEACFDTRGRPVECSRTGFHRSATRFDAAGRSVERRFFDEKGAPTTNIGCAIRRFRYDNYDHEYEAVDLDDKGQVIETYTKATLRTLYDQSHRVFAVLLLDRQGRPSRYSGCFTNVDCPGLAWHAVRVVRDRKGAVVKNLYFDASRQLINTMDCRTRRCWH